MGLEPGAFQPPSRREWDRRVTHLPECWTGAWASQGWSSPEHLCPGRGRGRRWNWKAACPHFLIPEARRQLVSCPVTLPPSRTAFPAQRPGSTTANAHSRRVPPTGRRRSTALQAQCPLPQGGRSERFAGSLFRRHTSLRDARNAGQLGPLDMPCLATCPHASHSWISGLGDCPMDFLKKRDVTDPNCKHLSGVLGGSP